MFIYIYNIYAYALYILLTEGPKAARVTPNERASMSTVADSMLQSRDRS